MTSRIEDGRRRASRAKRALALLAATAFAGGVALARESHPGSAASSGSTVTQREDPTFDFGEGSLQPSYGDPQVQSGAS